MEEKFPKKISVEARLAESICPECGKTIRPIVRHDLPVEYYGQVCVYQAIQYSRRYKDCAETDVVVYASIFPSRPEEFKRLKPEELDSAYNDALSKLEKRNIMEEVNPKIAEFADRVERLFSEAGVFKVYVSGLGSTVYRGDLKVQIIDAYMDWKKFLLGKFTAK